MRGPRQCRWLSRVLRDPMTNSTMAPAMLMWPNLSLATIRVQATTKTKVGFLRTRMNVTGVCVAGDLSSSGRSKCGPSIVRDSLLIMSETRAFWAAVTRLTLGWLGSTACEG
jgi:hypothetical protein